MDGCALNCPTNFPDRPHCEKTKMRARCGDNARKTKTFIVELYMLFSVYYFQNTMQHNYPPVGCTPDFHSLYGVVIVGEVK